MGAKKIKTEQFQPHVLEFLSSIHRDQIIMKLDKAIKLVKLLDKHTIQDSNTVFFDPFCKAGEILLACAITSLQYKKQRPVSDTEIKNYIHKSARFFGLSLDDRHYRMSMRTFYGNKGYEHKQLNLRESLRKGNIVKGSCLNEKDGKFQEDNFKKELRVMIEHIKEKTGSKKIIAIGNPPYTERSEQKGENRNGNDNDIFTKILEIIYDHKDIKQSAFVIPSKWFIGKHKFRKYIKEIDHIKKIHVFENFKDIFPTVNLTGGVCYIHRDLSHKDRTFYLYKDSKKIKLDINIFDNQVSLDVINSKSITDKIKNHHNGKFLNEVVRGWDFYKFAKREKLNYRGRKKKICYAKKGMNLNNYISEEELFKRIENTKDEKDIKNSINKYKVAIPKRYGAKRCLPKNSFHVLKPNEIVNDAYLILDYFKSKKDVDKFLKFITSDLSRFLSALLATDRWRYKDRWIYVPYMNFNSSWTDEKLFKYFNLTKQEQDYVREMIKKWS